MKKINIKVVICICLAVVCLIVLGVTSWNFYIRTQEINTQQLIQEIAVSPDLENFVFEPPVNMQVSGQEEPLADDTETDEPETEEPEPEPSITLKPRKPNERFINFAQLREYNPDVIAWIEIPGTAIDYPIVSTFCNAFYLNHDLFGNRSSFGTIFMDILNNPNWEDLFIIVYGHNRRDGSKFAGLHNFRDENFFNNNRIIHIYTPEGQLDYFIFAAYEWDDRHLMFGRNVWTPDGLKDYLNEVRNSNPQRSNFDMDGVTEFDSFLTLSTCTAQDDVRFLVQAIFMPP